MMTLQVFQVTEFPNIARHLVFIKSTVVVKQIVCSRKLNIPKRKVTEFPDIARPLDLIKSMLVVKQILEPCVQDIRHLYI